MIWAIAIAGGLFVGMLALEEAGHRLGAQRLARDPEGIRTGAIEGAVFGLLGLLMAFTFSGAASRFDDRRHLVIDEANMIGTAWLRIDVLPAGAQPDLRDLFRRYLDSRIETYRKLPDLEAAKLELARSASLQNDIWAAAVAGSRISDTPAASLVLLPALNEMIDITTTRTMMGEVHPPPVLFVLLAAVALISALVAGYGMAGKTRNSIHTIAFAFVVATTVYVIFDIEYPRFGLIRVDAVDHVLVDLRQSMK